MIDDLMDEFDAAKEICKVLNCRTDRSKRRILTFFIDLINENGDMQEEYEVMECVASSLGIRIN